MMTLSDIKNLLPDQENTKIDLKGMAKEQKEIDKRLAMAVEDGRIDISDVLTMSYYEKKKWLERYDHDKV